MSRGTLELVSALIEAAKYSEAERLVRVLEHRTSAAGEATAAHLFAAVREACRACQEQHTEMQVHWQAATEGSAQESRLRLRLNSLLGRAVENAELSQQIARPNSLQHSPTAGLPSKAHSLKAYCLGRFRILTGGAESGTPRSRRVTSILKYLLVHREYPTRKEVLMDLMWPSAAPVAARNNLHVAIHGLRRYLRDTGGGGNHVLFQSQGYILNPNLALWVDLDQFNCHLTAARRLHTNGAGSLALRELEAAEALYDGPLFADDQYEDWTVTPRRAAEDKYVEMLEVLVKHYRASANDDACTRVARKILTIQPANETAHRELMQIYARVGHNHLAVRQFRDCANALAAELDVAPSPETVQLLEEVRGRKSV